MARGAEKEIALTPEEKLAMALVPETEQPYRVPENWRWVHLLDSFENVTNSKKKIQQKDYLEHGEIAIVDQGQDLVGGYTNDPDIQYAGALPVILFGDHTRCLKFIDFPFAQGADGVKILKPKSFYNPKAFYYALQGIDIPNMGYRRHYPLFKNYSIVLPPFAEQQRIVDRIESLFAKLDEAKEKAQAVVDGFENRKAAILHKAFTGELTAEWRKTHNVSFKTWKRASIDSFCEVFSGKGFKEKEYSISGIKLLRISNVTYDSLIWDDTKYLPESYLADVPELVLKPEDIVMALNRPITNGKLKVSIVGNEDVYILYQRVGCLRIRNQSNLLTEYFRYALLSKDFLHQVECNLQGSDQPYINLPPLKKLTLNICSIQEQHEIVRIISDIDASEKQAKTAAEQVIDQIDTMKKAILARAFRGELGTNDPMEESAEELLKQNHRI